MRAILGDPSLWDPLDLPWDEMPDTPDVPRDRGARPSLDVVLELRRDPLTRQLRTGRTQAIKASPGYPPVIYPPASRRPGAGHIYASRLRNR